MYVTCLTWYPIVLERHHSNRICLMLLALDTPKLWDRFSLGLESTGLGWLKQIGSTHEFKSLEESNINMRQRDCGYKAQNPTYYSQNPVAQKWFCVPEPRCCGGEFVTSQAHVCAPCPCQRRALLQYLHSWYTQYLYYMPQSFKGSLQHFSGLEHYSIVLVFLCQSE